MKSSAPDSEFCAIVEEPPFSSKTMLELIQATLEKDASLRFKVKGFSMCPFIRDEDVVTVSPLKYSSVGLGRVVAFMHPKTDKLVIHRVVGNHNSAYFIKGDNAFCPDGVIPRKNILGYISRIERNKRNLPLGLGRERWAIALLSRYFFFPAWLCFLHRTLRLLTRRALG